MGWGKTLHSSGSCAVRLCCLQEAKAGHKHHCGITQHPGSTPTPQILPLPTRPVHPCSRPVSPPSAVWLCHLWCPPASL